MSEKDKKDPPGKDLRPKPDTPKDTAKGEIGGRKGPEPTRYGDWEKKGLISDF